MRYLPSINLALLALILSVSPAWTQNGDEASLYQIQDVAVDVTADSASHARDQAILQAQHAAFETLLARLNADVGLAEKEGDNNLAAIVQGFEVQEERISSVRYIGTFTVQFKPGAVRNFLGKNGVTVNETRSPPVLVLPVVNTGGRFILWEDATKWRAAWDNAAHHGGFVPLVTPAGDLDDIKVLSTAEAVSGTPDSLQALTQKYQAGSALVAVLNADPDHPDAKQDLRLDLKAYDSAGKPAGDPVHLSLPAAPDAKAMQSALESGIKQARADMEQRWKQANKAPKSPLVHLPVTAPIANLVDWATLKGKIATVPNISRLDVLSLSRDGVAMEIEFRGDIPQLQTALTQKGLALEEVAGAWTLRVAMPPP